MSRRRRQDVQARQDEDPTSDLDEGPEVMTIAELAALLRLSLNKTYDAAAKGEIPGVRKIGGTWRASRRAVLRWLDQGRVSRSEGVIR